MSPLPHGPVLPVAITAPLFSADAWDRALRLLAPDALHAPKGAIVGIPMPLSYHTNSHGLEYTSSPRQFLVSKGRGRFAPVDYLDIAPEHQPAAADVLLRLTIPDHGYESLEALIEDRFVLDPDWDAHVLRLSVFRAGLLLSVHPEEFPSSRKTIYDRARFYPPYTAAWPSLHGAVCALLPDANSAHAQMQSRGGLTQIAEVASALLPAHPFPKKPAPYRVPDLSDIPRYG